MNRQNNHFVDSILPAHKFLMFSSDFEHYELGNLCLGQNSGLAIWYWEVANLALRVIKGCYVICLRINRSEIRHVWITAMVSGVSLLAGSMTSRLIKPDIHWLGFRTKSDLIKCTPLFFHSIASIEGQRCIM